MTLWNRRTFVSLAPGLLADRTTIPIIDTHIHLFDTKRPQGVPWPPKDNPILFKPALPERYAGIAEPLGVVGAIEIEASPWLEDNQWVLDIAANNRIIVGTVGNLEPGKPEFRQQLDRFSKNPLFRGIRYGNLWGRNLRARLDEPAFITDLKSLASAGLGLDTANPDPALIEDIVRLTDKVPDLRVIIDHLPHLQLPADRTARDVYESNLRKLGQRPQVYVKVSAVLQRINGQIPLEVNTYHPVLDHLWDVFGQDRLIYGSDWPNSDPWGTYAQVLNIVQTYFAGKGRSAEEKFFWKNSMAAYRWVKRTAAQPDNRTER